MKKIITIIVLIVGVLSLTACGSVFATNIQESEAHFQQLVSERRNASIAIRNQFTNDEADEETRFGNGLIFQVDEGILSVYTYYAVTTQYVVEGSITVNVYVTANEIVVGSVLGQKLYYEADEDIAVVRFTSSRSLTVIALEAVDNLVEYDTFDVFSIGSIISTTYFNYIAGAGAMNYRESEHFIIHGANLNTGNEGSPLYLKSTGQLIGINVYVSTTVVSGDDVRPVDRLHEAISVNRVIDLVDQILSL